MHKVSGSLEMKTATTKAMFRCMASHTAKLSKKLLLQMPAQFMIPNIEFSHKIHIGLRNICAFCSGPSLINSQQRIAEHRFAIVAANQLVERSNQLVNQSPRYA
mmetsp:Transcript_168331/g.540806  ORF Transcript_168331/g.540806 Transcript_168331/m.540806 type:complete len:104 (-) Transcript_168331:148-459(-)